MFSAAASFFLPGRDLEIIHKSECFFLFFFLPNSLLRVNFVPGFIFPDQYQCYMLDVSNKQKCSEGASTSTAAYVQDVYFNLLTLL